MQNSWLLLQEATNIKISLSAPKSLKASGKGIKSFPLVRSALTATPPDAIKRQPVRRPHALEDDVFMTEMVFGPLLRPFKADETDHIRIFTIVGYALQERMPSLVCSIVCAVIRRDR